MNHETISPSLSLISSYHTNSVPFPFFARIISYQLCSHSFSARFLPYQPCFLPFPCQVPFILTVFPSLSLPGSFHTNSVPFPFIARFLSYQQCSLPFHCQVPFIPKVQQCQDPIKPIVFLSLSSQVPIIPTWFPSLSLPGSFHTHMVPFPFIKIYFNT